MFAVKYDLNTLQFNSNKLSLKFWPKTPRNSVDK